MMPAMDSTPCSSAMTQTLSSRVGLAVEGDDGLVARAAHGEVALHLLGVEHMQRPRGRRS
jgi:hypothetical protein